MSEDKYLDTVVKAIAEHGVMIQGVFAGEDDEPAPPFAYTVGLAMEDHPELIVFGLPMETAQAILNDLAIERVLKGRKNLTAGQELRDVVKNYPVRLVQVVDSSTHLTVANALFQQEPEPIAALQVVFPDRDGRWPWDPQCSPKVASMPLLGVWEDPS